jgi:hypothetical protein
MKLIAPPIFIILLLYLFFQHNGKIEATPIDKNISKTYLIGKWDNHKSESDINNQFGSKIITGHLISIDDKYYKMCKYSNVKRYKKPCSDPINWEYKNDTIYLGDKIKMSLLFIDSCNILIDGNKYKKVNCK